MTLLDLVRLLRRHLLTLLLGMVIGTLIAAAWTFTRPTVYQAQAIGLVTAGDSTSIANAQQGDMFAQGRASSYVQLLSSRPVAQKVANDLAAQGVKPGSYSGSGQPGTAFIRITATASTPQAAKATADAALKALTAEAVRMETYGKAQAGVPEEELAKYTAVHILPYEPAVQPTAPVRENLLRNLVLGAGAGLVLAGLYVILRRQLDVKVRSREEVQQLTGHAVLGVVPDSKEVRKQRGTGALDVTGQAGEAMRKLRTNLRFVNVDSPLRALVVSSANPGEGKSTIASQLARLMALSGQRVIVVDCDLRRPMQATVFGLDKGVGLSQVLAGDVAARDALVQTDTKGLQVLTAGRIPPNPSELLGSKRMVELIAELSKEALVVIDAPPMLAVTDAALLAKVTDGMLFVTVPGKTHKEQVKACAEQLEVVKAPLLGTVLNRVPRRLLAEVAYGGYAYSGYYGSKDKYYSATPEVPLEEVTIPEPAQVSDYATATLAASAVPSDAVVQSASGGAGAASASTVQTGSAQETTAVQAAVAAAPRPVPADLYRPPTAPAQPVPPRPSTEHRPARSAITANEPETDVPFERPRRGFTGVEL